jgi:hypothetical protein
MEKKMKYLLIFLLASASLSYAAQAKKNGLKICETNGSDATLTLSEEMGTLVLMSAGVEKSDISKEQARIHILKYLIVNNGTLTPRVQNLCDFSDKQLSAFVEEVCTDNVNLNSANQDRCKRRIFKLLGNI